MSKIISKSSSNTANTIKYTRQRLYYQWFLYRSQKSKSNHRSGSDQKTGLDWRFKAKT